MVTGQAVVTRILLLILCSVSFIPIKCTTKSALKTATSAMLVQNAKKPSRSPFQKRPDDMQGMFCTPNEKQHCLIGKWQSRSGIQKGSMEARLPRERTIDTVNKAQFWIIESSDGNNAAQVRMLSGSITRKSDSEIEATAEFPHKLQASGLVMRFTGSWDIPNHKWYGNFESRNPVDSGTFVLFSGHN